MEGLKVIEKSYSSLRKFKDIITSSSFNTATQLNINLNNYDMQTRAGIRDAMTPVLEVYKDDLDIVVSKVLCGDNLSIKLNRKVDGFVDDLIDALKYYINKRCGQLFTIITNSSNSGGGLPNGI